MMIKTIQTLVLNILLFIISQNAYATNYYISTKGNDQYSGTSVAKPWKSIQRLNKQILKPGDMVLFKKGESFFGEISIKQSGNTSKMIYFSSYGKGEKPIISGAISLNMAKNGDGSILESIVHQEVKSVFQSGKLKTLARFPNTGFLFMQGGVGDSVTFIDSSLNRPNGYWVNSNVRFRTWDWEIRTSKVKSYDGRKIIIEEPSTNKLEKGWGYYFDNKFDLLDSVGEWYYDNKTRKFYFYSGNQTQIKLHLVVKNIGINVERNVHDIQISDLKIQQFFLNGIVLNGNNSHVKLMNNEISNIDNTGILMNEVAKNCDVINNEIFNINGRGIFALEPENTLISKNFVHHIGLIMGYGLSGVNGMIGITIANNEVAKFEKSHIAINNNISFNKVDSVGYVGIRMDGAYSKLNNNVVSSALLNLSDGAAIYSWALTKYYSHDNQFLNNIVTDISGSNYGTPSGPKPIANGIYVDNRIYNCLVEGNTIANVTGAAIHINSDSYDNKINKNLVYNAQSALSIAEWIKPSTTFNNVFTNSTVVLTDEDSRGIMLVNWLLPSVKELGSFDNNMYFSLDGDSLMKEYYDKPVESKKVRIEKSYNLQELRNSYGFEKMGSFVNLKGFVTKNKLKPKLYYNTDSSPKHWLFKSGSSVYNLNKEKINDLVLNAFESSVLLETE